jgi:signal transduction histidine kinase
MLAVPDRCRVLREPPKPGATGRTRGYSARRIPAGVAPWHARGVRRPDLTDAGIVAAAGAVALLTASRDDPAYVVTLVFSTLMLTLLGLLLRLAATTFRAAYAERRRVRALGEVDPAALAQRAVRDERARLSGELDACIRTALWSIRQELAGMDGDGDGRERARRIHFRAREATTELRRQLGLLRADEATPRDTAVARPAPGLSRRTLALTGVVAVVAVLENWGYYSTGEYDTTTFSPTWSLPLTGLAAATIVGWRAAPVTAAATLAALLVVPSLTIGVMVGSGAWMVATIGCLTWALASRGVRDMRALLAVVALAGAVVWSRVHDDPENAAMCALLVAVTWVAGSVVGWNRRRQQAAAQRAAALQADLDAARDGAVQGARLGLARELHDVVSHAVGVVAMQAAAAEVSWPSRPEVALRAFETIDRVVGEALAELDRLVPDEMPAGRNHDLAALVERIRATGTTVQLTVHEVDVERADPIVYRVVQEGLTNAVRHAPSAAVDVLVEAVGDVVRVRVSDDGPGPDDGGSEGFGLVGLAERVSLRGGTLSTGPGPARGFVVEATVPAQRAGVM